MKKRKFKQQPGTAGLLISKGTLPAQDTAWQAHTFRETPQIERWWGSVPVEAQEVVAPWPRPEPGWEPIAFRRLFVQTPEDVLELAPSELALVWKHRNRLCGSAEAAAEVYAFLRAQDGRDPCYAGYEQFVALEEVRQAGTLLSRIEDLEDCVEEEQDLQSDLPVKQARPYPWPLASEPAAQLMPQQVVISGEPSSVLDEVHKALPTSSEGIEEPPFVLHEDDIEHVSHAALHQAWKRRKFAFADLRAAAAGLARLRYENRSDSILRPVEAYLHHPLVQELQDDLPEQAMPEEDAQVQPRTDEINSMRVDARNYEIRRSAAREGQMVFRQGLINVYGTRCCITGTDQLEVLQAAHVLPYKGLHTNDICNGLLMRSDIHQLFDSYLLAVHPDQLTVELSPRVQDEGYRALAGRTVDVRYVKSSYLREHYRMFTLKLL